MGGVVSSVGDVLGGAADFVGDVAGGVADFAGDVVQDFGPEIGTALALYYGIPYAAGAGAAGAGGLGAGLIAPEVAALGSLGSAGAGLGGVSAGLGSLGAIGSSLAGSSLLPGTIPGGGYQGGFIKTGIEGLDSALNLAKSGYDLYGLYNQTQQPTNQIIKYFKGLGTTKAKDVKDIFGIKTLQFKIDDDTNKSFDIAFNKTESAERKNG